MILLIFVGNLCYPPDSTSQLTSVGNTKRFRFMFSCNLKAKCPVWGRIFMEDYNSLNNSAHYVPNPNNAIFFRANHSTLPQILASSWIFSKRSDVVTSVYFKPFTRHCLRDECLLNLHDAGVFQQ